MKKIKNQITATRLARNKLILRSLRDNLNEQWKRLNVIKQEIGSSSWVSTLPNSDEEYMMTKQLFWDLVRTRYGWTLYCLPDKCACVEKFNLQHALPCKNGGFVSIRHNQIRRNITGSCNATENTEEEPRLDVCSRFLERWTASIFWCEFF